MIVIAEYEDEKQAKAVWATLEEGWLYKNKIYARLTELKYLVKTGAKVSVYCGEVKEIYKGGRFRKEYVIERGFR